MSLAGQVISEIATLHTPRARLGLFGALTSAIYMSQFSWLARLSLWQHLGLDWVPSIGLTRSYWLLLHGDPLAAWHFNPLIYAVLAVGAPLLIHDMWVVANSYKQRINQRNML